MKKQFWEGALMTAAALGLILIAVLIAAFIKKPPTESGDWATWTGAIGTILAFLGTIWLATSQERQRRREKLSIAHLVAARVAGELEVLITRTGTLASMTLFPKDVFATWGKLPSSSFPDQSNPLCDLEFLSLLAPLEGQVAHRIAKAIGLLQSVTADMAEARDKVAWEDLPQAEFKDMMRNWAKSVWDALDLLKVANNQCVDAVDVEVPHPSYEEIYGPDVISADDK